MIDNFPVNSASSQARSFYAITPHNTNELTHRFKAIYVGTGGNIVLVGDENGAGVTHAVSDNQVLLVSPKKILATGTTATGLVGWL